MNTRIALPLALSFATLVNGCSGAPLYPARPAATAGPPVADPEPTKIIAHISVTQEGLKGLMEHALPQSGEGTTEPEGGRAYDWERGPIDIRFADGRMHAQAALETGLDLPVIGRQSVTFTLAIAGEPVIGSDYRARLQGATVEITAADLKLRAANLVLGVVEKIQLEMQARIDGFAFDLTPYVQDAYGHLAEPIVLPAGDASACAALRVSAIEAAPTVMAGGFEKDLAITVAPSVTLPCTPPEIPTAPPPLANVSALPTGAFTLTVPVAARYDELAKAMQLAFTDGKLYFSPEQPDLYLTAPELYAAGDVLVLKVHLAGTAGAGGLSLELDGDIFFSGHPTVVDNELAIPDLQPTIETSSFLLGLKARLDGDAIRDTARSALRLDLGARFAAVRAKLSDDRRLGEGMGCLRTDVAKIAVTGVHPHGAYLRVYVAITAQTGVWIPCPSDNFSPEEGDDFTTSDVTSSESDLAPDFPAVGL